MSDRASDWAGTTPAMQLMTLDLLQHILNHASSPGELGEYLVQEMRELTGARLSVLFQLDVPGLVGEGRVISCSPERRQSQAEAPACGRLAARVGAMAAPLAWTSEQGDREAWRLGEQVGFGTGYGVPLWVGDDPIGVLLLLGLPGTLRLQTTVNGLEMLAPVVAALLSHATQYERMEHEIQSRTRELRDSEQRFRTLFEHAADNIMLLDPSSDGSPVIADINPLGAAMHGYEPRDLVGSPLTTLDPFMPLDAILSLMQGIDSEGTARFEAQHRHSDGTRLWLDVSARKLEVGGKQYYLSTERDITRRKQVEEDLNRHRHLLEQAQILGKIGTWELDLENDHLTWTDENYRIFGVPLGTPLNYASFLERVHPEDREMVDRAWKTASPTNPYDIEHRLLVAGEVKWVREKGEFQFDDEGAVVHAIGFTQDTTERRVFQEAQEALEKQLRETQKLEAIGTLAGGIAHDFNNILGAILGYSELALARLPKDSEVAEDLAEVLTAGGRARELVKQILAFSRKGKQERQVVQAHLVVGEAMRLLRQTIPSSIPMEQNLQKYDDEVLADPTQLHQIVMNLCTNAYHAMREAGGTLSVVLEPVEVSPALAATVSDLKVGPHVRLSVSDTGVGMDSSTRSRVFEPFFTTKAQGEGTGMGLSVVHGIVRSHEGAIQIESQLGRGTRIDVYLPRHSGSVGPGRDETSSLPGGRERVLVVDDEPALARLTQKMLASLGYRVESVSTSGEALEAFLKDSANIDLVLTDQTMPGLTGAILTQKMLEVRPDLPVIICTGYSESMDAEKARAIGARGFLRKPLALSSLALALRKALVEQPEPSESTKHR